MNWSRRFGILNHLSHLLFALLLIASAIFSYWMERSYTHDVQELFKANKTIRVALLTLDSLHILRSNEVNYLTSGSRLYFKAYQTSLVQEENNASILIKLLDEEGWPVATIHHLDSMRINFLHIQRRNMLNRYNKSKLNQIASIYQNNESGFKKITTLIHQIVLTEQIRVNKLKLEAENRSTIVTRNLGIFVGTMMIFLGISYIIVLIELKKRRYLADKLEHEATHDSLTGLYNRSYFIDWFHHCIFIAKRDKSYLAVLFIDIDGFKAINDSFGHRIGDEVLIEVARRLNKQARESDLVARFGGDEFILLQRKVESKNATLALAQRLINYISEPLPASLKVIGKLPTVSIGIAFYPENGLEPLELIRAADEAMYRAKIDGKDQVQIHHVTHNITLQPNSKL